MEHATSTVSRTFPASRIVSFVILAVSCYLMYLGYQLGELGKIFEKATMVCLQCIGIG